MTKSRDAAICAGVSIAAAAFHPIAKSWWFHTAIEGRSFTSYWASSMVTWPFEFGWFLILGVIVGVAIQSPRPAIWGAACGAFGSLVNFGITSHMYSPEAPWIMKALGYSEYVVPLVAAALGAIIGAMLKRRWSRGDHAV
jgi:hypothetical protein